MRNDEDQPKLEFVAEIKRTSQRKSSSLDNIYQIVLETDDAQILDLGKLPPDIVVVVNVKRLTEDFFNGKTNITK